MATITPFKIDVSDASLAKLKQKLELTQFPKGEIEEAGWDYGVPLQEVKDLTKYWIEKFDWRAAEKKLNAIPQFRTEIKVEGFDPIDLHFVHQKSDVKGAIPLLFLHGWPGNFLEVTKLLPLLKGDGGKQAFHVVAPSLANYGFSGRVTKKGFGLGQHAEVANNLMLSLGYDEYVTQGGDFGGIISRLMGIRYPQHVKASHINIVTALEPKWDEQNPKPEYSQREIEILKLREKWLKDGQGYSNIHSTKPATLAFSLTDSPTGLLAWIYEKLVTWSDSYPWTPDEVLTWISIYYFSTAGPAASIFKYYEAAKDLKLPMALVYGYIDVPLAIASFPKEFAQVPRSWWKGMGPIVDSAVFDKGGHFPAYERPEELAADVIRVFGKGGGAEGVVKGL